MELNRREFLAGAGSASAASLAGCTEFLNGDDNKQNLRESMSSEIDRRESDLQAYLDGEQEDRNPINYNVLDGINVSLNHQGGDVPETTVRVDLDTQINFESYDLDGSLHGDFEQDYAEMVRDITRRIHHDVRDVYGEREDIEDENRFSGDLIDTARDMPEIGDVQIRFNGIGEKYAWDRKNPETLDHESYTTENVMEDYRITQ